MPEWCANLEFGTQAGSHSLEPGDEMYQIEPLSRDGRRQPTSLASATVGEGSPRTDQSPCTRQPSESESATAAFFGRNWQALPHVKAFQCCQARQQLPGQLPERRPHQRGQPGRHRWEPRVGRNDGYVWPLDERLLNALKWTRLLLEASEKLGPSRS